MKVLVSHITIGDLVLKFVNHVEIKSSFKEMTDTATIKLPKNIRVEKRRILEYIQTGMPVKIELGYNGILRTEFEGYVARSPKPTMPIEIQCEDEMWQLKQKSYKKTFTNTTLKKIVEHIAPGYQVDAYNFSIQEYRINNATGAQVLKALANQYGFKAFFQAGKLIVGKIHTQNLPQVTYHFQKNVIENNLEYRVKDDIKIKIKAISLNSNNEKTELEVGDTDGQQRTLHAYNLSKTELKALAEREIDLFKVDGYRGDLTAFGEPYCSHGYTVRIIDQEYEARDSIYFVDSLEVLFGTSGFRRIVTLGNKAA